MSYHVKLETFEGPLDLLLYLIRKNDMDICNIEIAKITDQYLDFLNAMRTLDVDLAGEFIVMAATLIYIKSKMILPSPEMEAEEEGLDPKEALIKRLIEYQQYKMAAESLSKSPILNEDLFKVHLCFEEAPNPDIHPKEILLEVGIYELALAFQEMITRTIRVVHHIEADTMTIEQKVIEIVEKINRELNETLHFQHLFPPSPSRSEVVLTFLAILELTKLQFIKVYQADFLTDIHLKVTEKMSGFNPESFRSIYAK